MIEIAIGAIIVALIFDFVNGFMILQILLQQLLEHVF